MSKSSHEATAVALRESLNDIVAQQGADLEDVEISMAGRRALIRVIVDADGGIDLDAIAAISQAVSVALDDPDGAGQLLASLGSHPYTLEVTSPGTQRPLTLPRHWRRNVSRLVDITLAEPSRDGDGSVIVGRITGVDDTHVHLDVEGEPADIPLSAIAHATVQIEFRRPDQTT
jgi:ribosome maturation factor RimP